MGTKCRRRLKIDSVPSIFNFTVPKKRRAVSIRRAEDKSKKILLEEALRTFENQSSSLEVADVEPVKVEPEIRYKEVAVGTDNINIDKCVGNHVSQKSRKIQFESNKKSIS